VAYFVGPTCNLNTFSRGSLFDDPMINYTMIVISALQSQLSLK